MQWIIWVLLALLVLLIVRRVNKNKGNNEGETVFQKIKRACCGTKKRKW